MEKILVPVDGSDASCRAAAAAADLARALRADITLLYVFEHKPKQEDKSSFAFERGEAWLGGLQADRRIEHGDPATRINAVAQTEGFDRVVMGKRGLSPLGEQLLGSVSAGVLQRATCPVTLVR